VSGGTLLDDDDRELVAPLPSAADPSQDFCSIPDLHNEKTYRVHCPWSEPDLRSPGDLIGNQF